MLLWPTERIEQKAVDVAIGQLRGFLYPSPAERAAAYELLIELATRTTTIATKSSEGTIRTAFTSLHAMFDITRSILRTHGAEASKGSGGNLSLAVIAVRMLNDVIRPVLTQWHPTLEAYEASRPPDATALSAVEWERLWPRGPQCRSDLRAMRQSLRAYMDTLGRVAGATALADSIAGTPTSMMFQQQALLETPPNPDGLVPRRRMVRWLRLAEMWRAAPATAAANRELRARVARRAAGDAKAVTGAVPTAVFGMEAGKEFWFDYVADLGDAFDGTAPVAWLIGRHRLSIPADRGEELPPPPSFLPRGRLLVFGGDEVYPFAGAGVYEAQTELPFVMGLEPSLTVGAARREPVPADVSLSGTPGLPAAPLRRDDSSFQRFQAAVSSVVKEHGGRLVETLDDTVTFLCPDPAVGLDIGLALIDAAAPGHALSGVRVGIDHGPAQWSYGRVLGDTVVRSTDLADTAEPATVVVAAAVADAMGGDDRFSFAALGRIELADLGAEAVWTCTRGVGSAPTATGPNRTASAATVANPNVSASTAPARHAPPIVVAIPGNHDWLGGIEHFKRIFFSTAGRRFAGHWSTVQSQLWWHVQLPQGWWLWGIDTGLHNKMPEEEIEYFRRAAEGLRPGDHVILCTPVPLWQLRQKEPDSYGAIRSVLDSLIVAQGATLPLCLSGDSHFFAHFERTDSDVAEDHITAGGGGAFLHPTHGIPEQIPLERGASEFKLTSRWPPAADSRSLAPGAHNLHDAQYRLIIVLLAGLHVAFAWLVSRQLGRAPWSPTAAPESDALAHRWREVLRWITASPFALALLAVLCVAASALVRANSREPRLVRAARSYGLLIGVVLSTSLVTVEGLRLFIRPHPAWAGVAVASLVGGVCTTALLFGLLGWVNEQIKAGDNLAFSAGHLTRFKHFVKFRIDAGGDLTCFVVGIDPVGKGWYEAMTETKLVPPHDPAGIPRIHYVWGKTYPKFVPQQLKISVSISDDPTSDLSAVALLFQRVCGALIDGGHTLLYGGLPGVGYTEALRLREENRHADNPNAEHHLVNYVSDSKATIPGDDGLVRSIRVPHVVVAGESAVVAEIRGYTEMRRRMTRDADVRIVVGGNLQPSTPGTRLAPGVLEEAYLAMTHGVPLLVVGGFGGAAGMIADALIGSVDPAILDRLDAHFVRPEPSVDGSAPADFLTMITACDSLGRLHNGLSDGENRELLRTSDPDTATALILRGVRRVATHRSG